MRKVPRPSALAVYSGVSKETADVALRRQVVNLVRLHLLDDADQIGGVGQIAVVQDEVAVLHVRVLVEMVDAVGVEERGAALDAVDDVALLQQELGEIGAILAGDAGDQGDFCRHCRTFQFTGIGRILSQKQDTRRNLR